MGRLFLVVAIALGSAAPVLAIDPGAAIKKARQVIIDHRLLTKFELSCSTFVPHDDLPGSVAVVDVHEQHDKRCGGDPNTGPRRFTLEINMKTGAAMWDYNEDMEMAPVPGR